MKQKRTLTEEEHIALCEVGNSFWKELGKLTAKHLAMMPESLEDLSLSYLQDRASLYGSDYSSYLSDARKSA